MWNLFNIFKTNETDDTKKCEQCKKYTNVEIKWCKLCQINYLKENFNNWTSGNEKIDNLIQEMQLKINDYKDIIFEWIPYNQFNVIKGKGEFSLATWKNGPLLWDKSKYTRDTNKATVALKICSYNEILNKVI